MTRSVVVLPNKNKVARKDIEKARALLARKFLWELLAAAKQQVDVATWCKEGGLEAEDFLDAIDSGRPHPLLRSWKNARLCSGQPPGTEPARAACPPFGCLALRCAGARRTGQATGKTAGFAAAGVTVGVIRPAPIRSRARALATGGTCTYARRWMCYRERDGQRRSA